MDIRLLRPADIPHVQQTNITNLPENYFCKYYMYHAMSWPQLSYVAVDVCTVRTNDEKALTSLVPGLAPEEDTIRCSKDRGLCIGKDGRRADRWRTTRTHYLAQRHEDTQETGTGREAHEAES